jgi:YVTN family beta-propeller protein
MAHVLKSSSHERKDHYGSSYLFKYLRILSVTIIKGEYRLLVASSVGVSIIMSLLLGACSSVDAQTLESITQQRKSLGEGPQITVGKGPTDIQVNEATNKIYVANRDSGTVSVIDSDSGNTKTIRVGTSPRSIAIDPEMNKIYVLNNGRNSTVSVIDGYNDIKIKDIPVGNNSTEIAIDTPAHMIYVTNTDSDTVSVIDGTTNTKRHDVRVGLGPTVMAIDSRTHEVYVLNSPAGPATNGTVSNGTVSNGTVSVIDGYNDIKIGPDFPVGIGPSAIATYFFGSYSYIFVVNSGISLFDKEEEKFSCELGSFPCPLNHINGSIYTIIRPPTNVKPNDIPIGNNATAIAVDPIERYPRMIYVANSGSNTVSAIIVDENATKYDIPVGINPTAIAIDRYTNKVYLLNHGTNSTLVAYAKTASKLL